MPLVSIVILTYSEKRLDDLSELLRSIEIQSYRRIETVVVVERSEAISEFVKERTSKYPKNVYFTREKMSVSQARNIGVSLALGDIIAFVDDDATLSSDWSTKLVESFLSHSEIIGVTGRAVPSTTSADLKNFPKSLYWAVGCTRPRDVQSHYTSFASGVNMAFRREAFGTHHFMIDVFGDSGNPGTMQAHGGLPNDENDFAVRLTTDLNRPILYNSGLVVFHKVYAERTAARIVRRYAFWQGFAEARYQANPKWRTARDAIYTVSLPTLAADLLSTEGGFKSSISRLALLFASLLFVAIGFCAYSNRFSYRLGQSMLQGFRAERQKAG